MLLSDLDELVLAVRDRNSRAYIQEAVAAYRGRAYRASVVSAWVAVVYDVIGKVRELAGHGEKAAEAFVAELDAAIAAANVVKLQQIENGVLDDARDKFEFLSKPETDALARLRADRNACAHPAFTGDSLLFTPTPDQARAHIVHAVDCLLRHPPVQGKAALARIKSDVLQPSFPKDQDQVTRYLAAKYLDHAKLSLVETLVTVLLKVLLRGSDRDLAGHEASVGRCLRAVAERHPDVYQRQMRDQLPRLTADADDKQMTNVFVVLGADPRAWNWLDEPARLRIRHLATSMTVGGGDDVFAAFEEKSTTAASLLSHALAVPELRESALAGFRGLSSRAQETIISQAPRPELGDEAVRLYAAAGSYRRAESLGRAVLLPMAAYLTAEQTRAVLRAVGENGELTNAAGTPAIIAEFFERTSVHHEATKANWQELMRSLAEPHDDPEDHYAYPGLRKKLEARGYWPPR